MLSHFHLYGELRFSAVMRRRNGLLGLREDDDDVCFPALHWFCDDCEKVVMNVNGAVGPICIYSV